MFTRLSSAVIRNSAASLLLAGLWSFPAYAAQRSHAVSAPSAVDARGSSGAVGAKTLIESAASGLDKSAEQLLKALNNRKDYMANFTFFLHERGAIEQSDAIRDTAEFRLRKGLDILQQTDSAVACYPDVNKIKAMLALQKTLSVQLEEKHRKMDLGGIIADLRYRAQIMQQTAAAARRLLIALSDR